MLPKWVYPVLILFVVFFILSSPETAGPQARGFFGWLGDQASALGTCFDGLFDDDGTPDEGPATTIDGGTDSFETRGHRFTL